MILFVVPSTIRVSIIESQIINFAKALRGEGRKIIYLPISVNKLNFRNHDDIEIIQNNLKSFILNSKEPIELVYTRGYDDFIKLFVMRLLYRKTYKIVYDFRAPINEESYFRNKSYIRKYLLYVFEKWIFNKADYIQTVSSNLRKYLHNEFGEGKKISLVPCSVTSVILKKTRFNKKNIKFVYIGSVSKWQNFRETIRLYKKIEKTLVHTTFTVFTLDVDKAKQIINEELLTNYVVISKTHSQVLHSLSEYDYGFLLRDNVIINRVASPVKFVEYMSRGVIPIISEGVGDYAKLVLNKKIGIIVDSNFNQLINEIKCLNRDPRIHKRLYDVACDYTWLNTTRQSPCKLYS